MNNIKKIRVCQLLGIQDENDINEKYNSIISYGIKIYYKVKSSQYPWMPTENSIIEDIVSDALLIATENYDEESGMQFESFFYQKIQGEMHKWSSKRRTENKYLKEVAGQDGDIHRAFLNGEMRIEITTEESKDILAQLEKEDNVKRKVKANSIALGDLPFDHQIVLKMFMEGESYSNMAEILGVSEDEVKARRDIALSLLLKKVLRSKHLNDEEKKEIAELYGIDNPQ